MIAGGPDTLALALAGAAVFAGAVLQGAVGFGLALVAAPLLFLIDPRLVPGPLTFASLLLVCLTAYRDRRGIEFSGMGWGILGRFPGTLLGAALLAVLTPESMALPLAGLVLASVAMSASGLRFAPTPPTLVVAGFLSGFMGTASSIGGPPLALVYQHKPGRTLRGTLAGFFVIGGLMSLAGIGAVGRFGVAEAISGFALMPGILLGFLVSSRLTPLLDRGYTRHAVLTVAAAAGIGVVLRQIL